MATNQKYQFIYNGVEYDATDYVKNHPGGIEFIQNMKNQRKDFTEYFRFTFYLFRALHSDQAEKILKSFPIISVGDASKQS